MVRKNLINAILQNCQKPNGFWGRIMLHGMNSGHAALIKWGLEQIRWQNGWTVLDAGCGGGAAAAELLKLCPEGKIYGLDISPDSVAVAKDKNKKLLGSHCFIDLGNVEEIPYPNQTFDAVTAFETIYFWENIAKCLQEVRRVLKSGGLFLICVACCDKASDVWSRHIAGMTVRSPEEISLLLENAGFSKITWQRRPDGSGELCVVAKK